MSAPLSSFLGIVLLNAVIFSPLQATCSLSLVKKQKSIEKIFQELRALDSSCSKRPRLQIEFARRAYLAGHFIESLWAVESALQRVRKDSPTYWQLQVLQGKNLNALNRFEEAIEVLRPIAIRNSATQASSSLKQRAHLALIESYYLRAGRNQDKNVFYLISLFMSRHPDSRYQPLLRDWLSYMQRR